MIQRIQLPSPLTSSIFSGTSGWPGPRSCRSSSLEVLCSCQEVASTGASRQATVGAGGCAHQCQAPAAHRHRHRHRSAAPSLLARTAPPRASARLFLARVARSQPGCLCRLIPSSPVSGSPGFPSSLLSWPCIKELTAHIYGRRIVNGLSVISVDLVLILPALKSWQFAFSDPKNSSTMPHEIFKHCQRHNGPKALSTLIHSTPLVQSRSFNKLWNLDQT